MALYRARRRLVEAEQLAGGEWRVVLRSGGERRYSPAEFAEHFELSPASASAQTRG